MCGIAGFINFSGHHLQSAQAKIEKMTRVLAHRGPDEEGFYVDEYAALGHRRLSIIDRASGRQPMSNANKRLTIVFNGEIYNFLELRDELQSFGYNFKTKSDTEVILAAYNKWGPKCCEKLWGMFAFAIWDKEKKSLFLARDRVGKKPLYYSFIKDGIAFSSEIKGVIAGDFCEKAIDPSALDCYLYFGYIPSPLSIFKGVRKVNPGHYLICTSNNYKSTKYWDISFECQKQYSFESAFEEFHHIFSDSVKRRLISEVPLGAFLSGGIDSTLVVSFMAELMGEQVKTNSIGFGEMDDELPVARMVAKHIGAEHREFYVTPKTIDVLEKIAWHFDEPFADSSALPTWYVCQMTKENVTVALSGDGGDESFGGYSFRYIPHLIESKLRKFIPQIIRLPFFGILASIYPKSPRLPKPLRLKTIFSNLAKSDALAFCMDLVWLENRFRNKLYNQDFLKKLKGFHPFETVLPFYKKAPANDALSRAQYTDIHFYMTDDVLVKVDRMSMAHALEVRSPFLDHRLLQFAATLPTKLKIKGKAGKVLLRGISKRRLPKAVADMPKKGFSIPAAKWLRKDLKDFAKEMIFKKDSIISSFLNESMVKNLWYQHQKGKQDHNVLLWAIMMLGLWEEKFLN